MKKDACPLKEIFIKRKLLIFINRLSGRGKAHNIFNTVNHLIGI